MKALRTKAEAPPAPSLRPSGPPEPAARAAAVVLLDLDEAADGQRLDNLLVRLCKGVPKSHLYQLIRSGQVRINGKRCSPQDGVAAGDRLRLPPVRVAAVTPRSAPAVEFPVIFEDDWLLVIDKPAGVAVHGGSGVSSGVIEQVRAARPQARFLELVHRLDRETSGVLMLARKRAALVAVQDQLRQRRVDKRYWALVAGRWPLRTKLLDSPLHKYLTADGERRVLVRSDGQSAVTRVTGLQHAALPTGDVVTLVECRIETGRTHQIRVHLGHAGLPIIGDQKYGDFTLNKTLDKLGYKCMYLHAFLVSIVHPIRHDPCRFEAPMPADFERALQATAG